jgi:hypothetical protein
MVDALRGKPKRLSLVCKYSVFPERPTYSAGPPWSWTHCVGEPPGASL